MIGTVDSKLNQMLPVSPTVLLDNCRAKKEGAEKIQAAFRGYQVRKEYETVRRGVVALQAQYR